MQTTEVFIILFTFSTALGQTCRECQIFKDVKRLKTANCYRRELVKVPRCHTSGIEVLDLSFNRLRDIQKDDFDSYPNIQVLYLSDNFIREIHNESFMDKPYLEGLDLSSNAFYHIPISIFHLSQLKWLHLSNIANPGMVEQIEKAVPITSPLTYLDLTNNKLTRLPDLGELPTLLHLNVSENKNSVLVNISTFAGLCSLKVFANENFKGSFNDPCDCLYLNRWLIQRGVVFSNFSCENNFRGDCNGSIPQEYINKYETCKKTFEEQQQTLFRHQVLKNTGIGIIVVMILITALSTILYRSKRNKKRKMEEHEEQAKRRKFNDRNYD
ncbi:nephrocan-like [Onthophagus taurus]|uniref:nephrocan-like n=1 Tax=Onthophagus taurus TaxID=166361 RepID=UPI000C206FEA|nr:vasorin-like [Onthophagus taurus]XP_022904801.1 vasorin-like [Onthophagus taurus]